MITKTLVFLFKLKRNKTINVGEKNFVPPEYKEVLTRKPEVECFLIKKGGIMKTIILLIIIFTSSTAHAEWTKEKFAYELCYVSVVVNDWMQTRDISKYNLKEENRIMGNHPSNTTIDTYFASLLLINMAINYVLPEDYAKLWKIYCIADHSNAISINNKNGLNQNIGIGYKFEYSIPF